MYCGLHFQFCLIITREISCILLSFLYHSKLIPKQRIFLVTDVSNSLNIKLHLIFLHVSEFLVLHVKNFIMNFSVQSLIEKAFNEIIFYLK